MVHYKNPLLVLGCVPEWDNKILLCKRASQLVKLLPMNSRNDVPFLDEAQEILPSSRALITWEAAQSCHPSFLF